MTGEALVGEKLEYINMREQQIRWQLGTANCVFATGPQSLINELQTPRAELRELKNELQALRDEL